MPNSDDAWRRPKPFNWATSATVGGVSEIAVLAPIRRGCPRGDRRTFEQIARAAIGNLNVRHAQGLPTELGKLSTIHFGRILILRPEHYLAYSLDAGGVRYGEPDSSPEDSPQEKASQEESDGGEADSHASEHEETTGDKPVPAASKSTKMNGSETPEPDKQKPRFLLPLDDFDETPPSNSQPRRSPGSQEGANAPYYRSWILTLVEFDGDLKVYMREIARSLGGDFDAIFKTCEGYPGTENYEAWWAWIRRFQINVDLFYATYPNLSVVRIKQLETFKRRFDAFVAQVRSPTGPRVRSMDELFDQFLAQNQQYATNFPSPGGLFPVDDDSLGG
jgi:hypothetical protein